MKKKPTIYVLLAMMTAAGCVSSQSTLMRQVETEQQIIEDTPLPSLDTKSGLSDYLRYATLNNPGLRAAFEDFRAAVENIPQARSLPDPMFTYGYFIDKVETRVGAQKQKFEISQMFPWFGSLSLKEEIAAQDAEAAYQAYKSKKQTLSYNLKNTYYEYYYLSQAITITERTVRLMSEMEAVARSKFTTSTVKHGSVIKAQVELGRLEDSLKGLQDLRTPLAAQLNALLNRPGDAKISFPPSISHNDITAGEDKILSLISESSPELEKLKHIAAKETAAIDLAKKSFYPQFMIGAGLIDTEKAATAGIEDSGKDPIIAMVGISLPVWRGKNSAAVREAQARERAAKQRLKDRKNSLLADIQLAFYHFRDADRKIALYKKGLLPKARESLQVNKQGFQTGKTTFLDVLDSERVLLEFELSYQRALATRAQRLAEIEMLTGTTLTTNNNNTKGGD